MKIRHWIPRGEVARDEVAQASCRWRRTGILPVSAGWKPALPDGHPACPTVSRFMGSLLSSARMHWDLEPTPNPSQEGSRTAWPVPLLGGVRGGFVARRFMQSVRRSVQRVNRVRCAPSLFALHALLLSASSGALAQEARLVNAQVQTRAITSSLEMDFRSLVHGQVEPAWIG